MILLLLLLLLLVLTAVSCHSVAVVRTLVQTKQIRINIHKRNNTKHSKYTYYQNTHKINKTPTHYKTHTCTHQHISKQVKQPQLINTKL